MKAGWTTKRLGEVCDVVNGGTPRTSVAEYWGGAHCWITPAEMGGDGSPYLDQTRRTLTDAGLHDSSASLVPAKSVILSSRAPIGHLVINLVPMATNQGCKSLVPKAEIEHKFLYYYLKSIVPLLESIGTGATFKELSGGKLKDVAISFPPLPEQRRIVALLDEAFAGLATAAANAARNLDNARELFESHLAEVFSRRGDGWVERRLAEACSITSTLVDPREARYQDLTHVGAGNIESVTGCFLELKSAREEQLISGKFLFDESMVLYSKIRPYLRKVARPEFGGLCSADMYPLAPNGSLVTRDFLFYLLLSRRFTEYAIKGSARAGMPKVNREHLFAFSAWFPDFEFQRELTATLDASASASQQLVNVYEQKQASLAELKKSLLHQAFSGSL